MSKRKGNSCIREKEKCVYIGNKEKYVYKSKRKCVDNRERGICGRERRSKKKKSHYKLRIVICVYEIRRFLRINEREKNKYK